MERAVEVAQSSGKKGLVVFKGFGFEKISRNPAETLMWLRLSDDAIVPEQFISRYKYVPVKGKVVVDLFFNSFCQTSDDIEAQRVEEVVREFGDQMVLNNYDAEDSSVRAGYELPRGIFVNGKEFFWGYEAPMEDIRETIREALISMGIEQD